MSDVGVEVGQKMRSAIKAKLTELDCYVDDELPDYIMVMIANKRTKSQMKDDLQLFLSTKTSTFVDWLHIVLKKLKEVHVTNPDVFKKPVKRKLDGILTEEDLKKIKKEKKDEARALKKARKEAKASKEMQKSLTDDLPITANKLSEARKIIVMKENQMAQNMAAHIDEDNFDIPLLSEINTSNEEELEMIEKKIKNVKSRLGLQVESDEEEDGDDFLNIKPDPDDLLMNDQLKLKLKEPQSRLGIQIMGRKITVEGSEKLSPIEMYSPGEKEDALKKIHTRITFDKEKDSMKAKYSAILDRHKEENQLKRKSVLDRLGKRPNCENTEERRTRNMDRREEDVRQRINNKLREKERREDQKIDKGKEALLSRVGVLSKVSIPQRRPRTPEQLLDEEEERQMTLKEVPSVVKLKPRILPPKTKQANPNLLFKAVAEAQRSVSQKPVMKSTTPEPPPPQPHQPDMSALFTKKYKEKMETKFIRKAKLLEEEKRKLKALINDTLTETVTIPVEIETEPVGNGSISQKFIVTLDGIEKSSFIKEDSKSIVKTKRTPSPIFFAKPKISKIIPDKLAVVHPAAALKNKERCKYWPGCRQGEKCEFFHPTTPCKMFPNCKFEDKCLYVHPTCKFETSCTRRDCPYSHAGSKSVSRLSTSTSAAISLKPVSQICKFFPNCSNVHCTYYHPRLCKFGVFCKNQPECNFVHSFPAKAGNLTWRSEHK